MSRSETLIIHLNQLHCLNPNQVLTPGYTRFYKCYNPCFFPNVPYVWAYILYSSNNYFSGTGASSIAKVALSTDYVNSESTRNSAITRVDHINSTLPVSQFSFVYSSDFSTSAYGIDGYVSINYYSNI